MQNTVNALQINRQQQSKQSATLRIDQLKKRFCEEFFLTFPTFKEKARFSQEHGVFRQKAKTKQNVNNDGETVPN